MKILMIAHFITLPWENGNCRFAYLANILKNREFDLDIVSSSFIHMEKKQRDLNDERINTLPYKVTLLHEPDYKKNVCIKRLISHKKFSKNLEKYLKQCKKPDIVYCAVPSLDLAVVASEYCEKNEIPFIIDIQDLWPEAFKMAFHIPILSNIIFAPMTRKANKIYVAADEIISVSKTYADRALRVNCKCDNAKVVYLGTDKDYFDRCVEEGAMPHDGGVIKLSDDNKNKIKLAYVGTLGSSYDLSVAFEAMRMLDKLKLDKLEFIVIGDGPRRAEFEEKAKDLPVVFTGYLAYTDMVWLLKHCDIAINPIRKGAAQSIINKHMDYAMSGLPVINTQECEEYRNLIEKYECGINCECGNAGDVEKAIIKLIENESMRINMGKNSRKMGEELFDRAIAYQEIIQVINDCGR